MRILLTWFPGMTFHPVTKFLAKICDPFLDLFHGIRWLRIGSIDLSPAIALCILGGLSSILSGLSHGNSLSFGIILALVIHTIWSIISSILSLIIIILIIRTIFLFLNKGKSFSSSMFIDTIDQALASIVGNVSKTFTGHNPVSYQTKLIITIVALIVISIIGNIVFIELTKIAAGLPF